MRAMFQDAAKTHHRRPIIVMNADIITFKIAVLGVIIVNATSTIIIGTRPHAVVH